jgi:magnesium transporter
MINLYSVTRGGLQQHDASADLASGMWIDLHDPTPDEEATVEKALSINIPTREEMREIEESARIYEEYGALFMTAVMIAGVSERRPVRSEVTFVLTPDHLVTVRYADPLPFKTFQQKCSRKPDDHDSSDLLFISLIQQIVARIADVLEKISTDLDSVAGDIFREEGVAAKGDETQKPQIDLQGTVRRLGRSSALLGKLRESLLSFSRILSFTRQSAESWLKPEMKAKAKSAERDITSLTEYAEHLASQIGHLQEATFSLINIEQNRVIKVFSIAAVLFLPPTLVATLYGMNFKNMPELGWEFGYPFALLLMVISALIPFYWFKRNGWL